MRILVIEDDPKMASVVSRALGEEGAAVDVAGNAPSGLISAESSGYDLIILDVLLPGGNGMDICRKLRQNGLKTPVLMLTCKDTVTDKIAGLNCGADDYLAKPFDVGELLARVQALLRRGVEYIPDYLTVGELAMNTLTREVSHKDKPVKLAPKEYAVLEFLMRHPNIPLSHTQIEQRIWNQEFDGSSNLIRVYMGGLRHKLGDKNASLIQTVRNFGYRLNV